MMISIKSFIDRWQDGRTEIFLYNRRRPGGHAAGPLSCRGADRTVPVLYTEADQGRASSDQ